MRKYLLNVAIIIAISCAGWVAAAIDTVADFCMTPFRVETGIAWRVVQRFRLVSYTVIRMLKPEYRESHDTHGLSMPATAMRFC